MQVECWQNNRIFPNLISNGVYSGTQLDSNRVLKISGLRLSAIANELCNALYFMKNILYTVFFVLYTMHKVMYSM